MRTVDLRVIDRDWMLMKRQFATSFRRPRAPETGVIGVLGICKSGSKSEFLLAKVFWPEPGDLRVANGQALVFDPGYIRRAHLFMRNERLSGLAIFHTHPFAVDHVAFSAFDDEEEPLMLANLLELEPRTQLVSVVVGRNSQQGRAWLSPTRTGALHELIVVGESLSYHPLSGEREPLPPPPAAAFDRGLALTGAGALGRLSKLKIAVVGASGTGSLICELLVRAGNRDLLIIDDKRARDVNLNRILHLRRDDVTKNAFKVDVLAREIDGLDMDCNVEAIAGNVLDNNVLSRLRDADVVFGCVDKAHPRLLLSRFSYQYLRPYIDVGSEIGGDDNGGVTCLMARASYVAPGRPCLLCTGVVTPRELQFESVSSDERERIAEQGYSADLLMDQPAVMDLNMRAASCGTIVLRHLLQPFLLTPLPITISENILTYTMLRVNGAKALDPNCRICQDNRHLGFGDIGPQIGLERAMVETISGQKPNTRSRWGGKMVRSIVRVLSGVLGRQK